MEKNDEIIQTVKDSSLFRGTRMKQCISNNHASSCGKELDLHVDCTRCIADLIHIKISSSCLLGWHRFLNFCKVLGSCGFMGSYKCVV